MITRPGPAVAPGTDRSEVVDFEATKRRELAGQAAGARPGRTDHPEDGAMVAKVREANRRKDCYRAAARCHPNVAAVPISGPVDLEILFQGDPREFEAGAWVVVMLKLPRRWDRPTRLPPAEIYVTAAEADAGVLP